MERLTKRGPYGTFEWSDYAVGLNDPIVIGETCREILGTAEDLGIDLKDVSTILKRHKEK